MAELNLGTLYDMNKTLYDKMPPLSGDELDKAKNLCTNFFAKNYISNTQYFALLCNEKKDFTVFANIYRTNPTVWVEDLFDCLNNRGIIKSIEMSEDNYALEIWIDNYVYYCFPYDNGVITY